MVAIEPVYALWCDAFNLIGGRKQDVDARDKRGHDERYGMWHRLASIRRRDLARGVAHDWAFDHKQTGAR
jgi:hypothetical protein